MHYYGFDISNIKLWILIFKIIKLALNLAAQVSVSQRGPERTTPADIYLQQQNMSSFYKKFTRCTRLFGQWKKFRTSIVCSVAFIYKTRDELSRHLCSALFMSSHLCWGTWLFPCPPRDRILVPPCATSLKKKSENRPCLHGSALMGHGC